MKLYYSKGACSLAVRIIINELNIPCEYEAVDLKTKLTEKGDDYKKTNAKGAVPALLLDNNEILTENAAIQQYLAETYHAEQLLPTAGQFKRYRILEWLNFVSTDVHKSFSPLFNPKVADDTKKEIFIPILKTKLVFVDQHLSDNKFLVGEQFTLPDSYLFAVLRWLVSFKIDIADYPNLSRYFHELKARPTIEKALHAEGLK